MTSLDEFLDIFKSTGLPRKPLVRFYRSVRKSVVLSYSGPKGLPLLLKLAEKDQWPILKEMDNPNLSIYKGADPELLAAFIETIKKQEENNSWLVLREMALRRARLYEAIFDFSPQEIAACEQEGRDFEGLLIRKKRRLMIGIGGGTAAAGVLGAGAFLWWKKTREKKE